MLAKVIPDRGAATADPGFAARIGYVCAKARQIELRNLAGGWIHAADQMRCIAGLNPRKRRPCRHIVLSWSPLERPTDAQMIAAARRVLRDLGAADHQAVIALHRDRPHRHVHIILNLIHPLTGRTLDLGHDYMRLEQACRRIEREMGWPADRSRFETEIVGDEIVLRPRAPEDWLQRRREREAGMRRETATMRGHERRTGVRPLHLRHATDRLQLITAALDGAGSWQQVHELMQVAGWVYRPHGSGARIVSRLEATWAIPASHLGARFSLRRMQDRLGVFAAQVGERLGQAARALHARLRQSEPTDDRNRMPSPDPDILEPLFQELSARHRQGRDARQAATELRERQAAKRHAVRQHLGSRRGIRSMILRQHREDRRLLRASQPRQAPLPLATHLLAADSPDYRLSLQYRLPARRGTAVGSADGTPAVQDHNRLPAGLGAGRTVAPDAGAGLPAGPAAGPPCRRPAFRGCRDDPGGASRSPRRHLRLLAHRSRPRRCRARPGFRRAGGPGADRRAQRPALPHRARSAQRHCDGHHERGRSRADPGRAQGGNGRATGADRPAPGRPGRRDRPVQTFPARSGCCGDIPRPGS